MGATQGKLKVDAGTNTAPPTVERNRRHRLKRFFKVATHAEKHTEVTESHGNSNGNAENYNNHCYYNGQATLRDSGIGTMGSSKSNKSSKQKKKNMESYITSILPLKSNNNNPDTCNSNQGTSKMQHHRTKPKLVKEHFDTRVTAKYDVKALIGKGSFSRVVRAEHRLSGQMYAIKLIPAKHGTGAFENELAILGRIRHKHVICLHEVMRTPNRLYMVMQLATGGELYDAIVSKGRFSEFETARCMSDMLEGLMYVHELGITHRDLKPENLLYTVYANNETHLIITDFGLAHQRQAHDIEESCMTDTCGTPEYIAPEVLLRFPYSNKVDLWATGVICYILLSGIMPFDDESRTRLYRQIIRGKYVFFPQFWRDVSTDAKQFVRQLLMTDPEHRPTAHQTYNHPWITNTLRNTVSQNNSKICLAVEEDLTCVNSLSEEFHTANPTKAADKSRTRSNRSIRSVARSDHGHRFDPREVDRISKDPEIKKMMFDKSRRSGSIMTAPAGFAGSRNSTTTRTNYGVI